MNPLAFDSFRWLSIADGLCLTGAVAAIASGISHARATRAGGERHLFSWIASSILWLTTVAMGMAVARRWIEVNHFPSQNMNEVLVMFSSALVLSMLVLHYVLGLHRRGAGWALLDDALLLLVFAAVLGTHAYVSTLNTAERDLPPALQSNWFAPHLSCLIFSYATLSIAALVVLVYFCLRFWSGVFAGGQSRSSQIWILAGLTLVPFVQLVTLPILLLVGAIVFVLKLRGRVPVAATIAGLEKKLDDVSFRAFAVGLPFLTAGLWMGAFWAQEAWANYWGWDSKENSALITWLIYIVYVHVRMLGGYRGEKAMAVLLAGALSVFMTFQLFGFLPDSQKSMHRYTDDGVVPREGMQGTKSDEQASADARTEEASR